jgi:hypothetical protein
MEVNYTDISKIYDNYRSYPESLIKKVMALGRISEGKKVLAELTIKRQRRGKNGISKFMANATLDDMGYPLARSLDCAMERCGFMEGCRQQAPMVVCGSAVA